jgi:hypothetical protein
MQAALVWCGAQLLVAPYLLWLSGRAVGTGPLRPLRAGLAMAGLTVAGLAAAATMPWVAPEAAGPVVLAVLRLAVFGAIVGAGLSMRFRVKSGWPVSIRQESRTG